MNRGICTLDSDIWPSVTFNAPIQRWQPLGNLYGQPFCEHIVGNITLWGCYYSLHSSGFSLSFHTRIEDEVLITCRCFRIALCTYSAALEASGHLHPCSLTFLQVLHRPPLVFFNQEPPVEQDGSREEGPWVVSDMLQPLLSTASKPALKDKHMLQASLALPKI